MHVFCGELCFSLLFLHNLLLLQLLDLEFELFKSELSLLFGPFQLFMVEALEAFVFFYSFLKIFLILSRDVLYKGV